MGDVEGSPLSDPPLVSPTNDQRHGADGSGSGNGNNGNGNDGGAPPTDTFGRQSSIDVTETIWGTGLSNNMASGQHIPQSSDRTAVPATPLNITLGAPSPLPAPVRTPRGSGHSTINDTSVNTSSTPMGMGMGMGGGASMTPSSTGGNESSHAANSERTVNDDNTTITTLEQSNTDNLTTSAAPSTADLEQANIPTIMDVTDEYDRSAEEKKVEEGFAPEDQYGSSYASTYGAYSSYTYPSSSTSAPSLAGPSSSAYSTTMMPSYAVPVHAPLGGSYLTGTGGPTGPSPSSHTTTLPSLTTYGPTAPYYVPPSSSSSVPAYQVHSYPSSYASMTSTSAPSYPQSSSHQSPLSSPNYGPSSTPSYYSPSHPAAMPSHYGGVGASSSPSSPSPHRYSPRHSPRVRLRMTYLFLLHESKRILYLLFE
jgi:hypothetical protein